LGLLSSPSQIPQVIVPSIFLALFLTFVGRPLAVFALLAPLRCSRPQKLLVSWSGIRGVASIVFVTIATAHIGTPEHDIFHIVFCIVLFSILLQGSLIPFFAKKLGMLDSDADVLKTFSDYTEEVPVQLVELPIPPDHIWVNRKVRDMQLPPGMLLVLIRRGGAFLVPNGQSVAESDDVLVLMARAFRQMENIHLSEIQLADGHTWVGRHLSEISLASQQLVVLIFRGNHTVIPSGRTLLHSGDTLVIQTEPTA